MRPKLAIVLGIRPDVIRASLILEQLSSSRHCELVFIWSGQHYSENLKDVFFRELAVRRPDVELHVGSDDDAEVVGHLIPQLSQVLRELRPMAAIFLGDTNTVMGAVAAAQLNIPVVHIEGCMRSYDWRMPEEKYRLVADHLSDVIYAYLEEYKAQGVREGLNPESIVVTGNPIVDVLHRYYLERPAYYEALAGPAFFQARGLVPQAYYLMTCHRRENVTDALPLRRILELVGHARRPVYFPASYRTQRAIRSFGLAVPPNVRIVDPVGYDEFLVLLTHSRGVFTDSGTVVEEACVLQVPAVQMRRSTERPQVYDVGACVKFDPSGAQETAPDMVLAKLEALRTRSWSQPFGDGRASERIVQDILDRVAMGGFDRHRPADYPFDISRAFRPDGL